MMKLIHSIDQALWDHKTARCGLSIAVSKGDEVTTACTGSGRYGQVFPVHPEMLFQAGSVSKSVFAITLLRFVDRGIIDLDADLSGVLSDFVDAPLTFSALLSHTAGFNVSGFPGYSVKHPPLSLEDVLSGRGNTPKVKQVKPYGKQYSYSGGGITLAELAFTRITGLTLQDAFAREVAQPLGLVHSGYFQPLPEEMAANAAFGGRLGRKDGHGYHVYPEHAAAGLWTTPAELTRIGIALSRSLRADGLLTRETAQRMITPVMNGYGLCIANMDEGAVGHVGLNKGFLTEWCLSTKEDLCVTAMINKVDFQTIRRLRATRMEMFRDAAEKA